jgi:hypothetical protein
VPDDGRVTGHDPRAAQDALARTTTVWGVGSVAAGLGLAAARRDPRARAFGLQNAAWGAADLAVVVVAQWLEARRRARWADPHAPDAVAREARTLRRALLVNVVLDAGYVAGGAALRRRGRDRPAAVGASAAMVLQGAFLLLNDARHLRRS